jgi:hypothetical protein
MAKAGRWHGACTAVDRTRNHMRRVIWIIPIILVFLAGCAGYGYPPGTGYPPGAGGPYDQVGQQYANAPQDYGQYSDSSYFYDLLSPYGSWIDYSPYGYVWTPRHMGYRWRPYSNGYWAWTDYGWTWVAEEEWGDIPFHYGRWGWDAAIGWFWVPGTVWGPAWVTWRSNDQYMGWAPLPPGVEFRLGMSFDPLSLDIPFNFWVFVQGRHFQDRNLYSYVLPYERNRTIVNYTSMHNNIYTRNDMIINEGLRPDDVRRITGRDVPRYTVRDAQRPGRTMIVGQEVQVFRPAVKQDGSARPKSYLNRDRAQQELAPARVFEPRAQQSVSAAAAAVQRRQTEEKALLQKTQAQEMQNMQNQRAADQAQVRDAADKAKIRADYQARTAELQKQHQAEKQQLADRHKQDSAQVKQATKPADKAKRKPPDKWK